MQAPPRRRSARPWREDGQDPVGGAETDFDDVGETAEGLPKDSFTTAGAVFRIGQGDPVVGHGPSMPRDTVFRGRIGTVLNPQRRASDGVQRPAGTLSQ